MVGPVRLDLGVSPRRATDVQAVEETKAIKKALEAYQAGSKTIVEKGDLTKGFTLLPSAAPMDALLQDVSARIDRVDERAHRRAIDTGQRLPRS